MPQHLTEEPFYPKFLQVRDDPCLRNSLTILGLPITPKCRLGTKESFVKLVCRKHSSLTVSNDNITKVVTTPNVSNDICGMDSIIVIIVVGGLGVGFNVRVVRG